MAVLADNFVCYADTTCTRIYPCEESCCCCQFWRSEAGISSGPEAAFWSILSIAAIMSSIVNSMNSSAKGT